MKFSRGCSLNKILVYPPKKFEENPKNPRIFLGISFIKSSYEKFRKNLKNLKNKKNKKNKKKQKNPKKSKKIKKNSKTPQNPKKIK